MLSLSIGTTEQNHAHSNGYRGKGEITFEFFVQDKILIFFNSYC